MKLGATEEFTCKAKDGNEVHGLITKPPDYQPGKKYPTLLRIHGGPNGQDAHSFNFERQLFAANGYVVVNVNYRGSSGRGEKYQVAIAADWGNLEVVDLQAAIDHVIAIGLADPDKLGVGGWSYGGILTDAIIAKDQRFKAATSGAGTAFPIALYGVDQYIMQYDEEIGAAVEGGDRAVAEDLVRLHARRQDQDADALHGRREGLQCPAGRRRADVPGAGQSRRPHAVSGLPELVPRDYAPELSEGPHGAISRLVREVSQLTGAIPDRRRRKTGAR